MAERFLKFIPSTETTQFAIKHKNAFVLLMIIAERARRTNGGADGLKAGQCHLGNHKDYGMTEKEYRYAKEVLVKKGLIKIIVTNRTRKKIQKKRSPILDEFGAAVGATVRAAVGATDGATENTPFGATELTTTGTLVQLCNSEVWDINSEDDNQQKGDRNFPERATDGADEGRLLGRSKGDKQERERKRKNEKEKEIPQSPLLPIPSKIKFRDNVELTQNEYDSLLAKNGLEFLNHMLDALDAYKGSKGVKYDSDFHTMKQGGWVVNRVKKDLENQQKTPKDEKNVRFTPGRTPPGNIAGTETKFQPSRVLRAGDEPAERPVGSGSVNE